LYLAWERSNLPGSAHMDFDSTALTPSTNGVTPVRTAGDLLIDFDFGGSGVPVIALHRWITTGNAATDCEASNTLPCWDKAVTLPPAYVEAAVNSAPVTDNNPPNAPLTLAETRRTASIRPSVRQPSTWPAQHLPQTCARTLVRREEPLPGAPSFRAEGRRSHHPDRHLELWAFQIVKVTDPSPARLTLFRLRHR
jgi:hypothetical protein